MQRRGHQGELSAVKLQVSVGLFRTLASALSLPQSCFLCDAASAEAICPDCAADLVYLRAVCERCGCALPMAGVLCGDCQRSPPHFSRARAVLAYAYPADRLILAAKFPNNLAVLHFLGELAARHFSFQTDCPDVLVPVPMHPSDLRRRGYNQAAEIAKRIAARHGIPLALDAARCVKRKRKQSSLPASERRRNVRGIFQVARREAHWRHVGIVDDVMTTGATVDELSKVWLAAGAERVSVWCCARAGI